MGGSCVFHPIYRVLRHQAVLSSMLAAAVRSHAMPGAHELTLLLVQSWCCCVVLIDV